MFDLEKNTRDEKDHPRRTKLHVFLENSEAKKRQFSECFQDEEECQEDDENLAGAANTVQLSVERVKIAISQSGQVVDTGLVTRH